MTHWMRRSLCLPLAAALALAATVPASAIAPQDEQPLPAKSLRFLGTVTSQDAASVTIKTDNGSIVKIGIQDATRLLQMPPGQNTLSAGVPIKIGDIQAGDRLLAVATPSPEGGYVAKTVVAMKQADIAQKQQREREDWQAHGVGGLVKSVDPSAETLALTTGALSGGRPLVIEATKSTVIRRYAPDSVKFDDATRSSFDQIQPGDQVRARGTKNADGTQLMATEIVSGTFRNIAGTVVSIDRAGSTATITDLATKKPLLVHFNNDSQLRKLPPTMAQGIAARLKRDTGSGAQNGHPGGGASPSPAGEQHGPAAGQQGGDLQQDLNRAPALQLSDLKAGDAVMVLTTQGQSSGSATAITLLAGVEPLLQASPGSSQSVLSASWNLNGGAPGGQDAQ